MDRGYYFSDVVDKDISSYEEVENEVRAKVDNPEQANLIGSLLPNGRHAPVIDLDFPARLVPSRTPGHFHLYLDMEVDWDAYILMLEAMRLAGVVQEGFVNLAKRRGQTFARTQRPTTQAPETGITSEEAPY